MPLRTEIRGSRQQNSRVYGVCLVWRRLKGHGAPPPAVQGALLMGVLGLREVMHGRRFKNTARVPETARVAVMVKRAFPAEGADVLRGAGLTCQATWSGFAHVAFVIFACSRRIVGWHTSALLRTDLTLDALEQALRGRTPQRGEDVVHHSDRGARLRVIWIFA